VSHILTDALLQFLAADFSHPTHARIWDFLKPFTVQDVVSFSASSPTPNAQKSGIFPAAIA